MKKFVTQLSDGWRRIRVLALALFCVAIVLPVSAVFAQSSIFPVDVWTDRGGEGTDVPGGVYAVGELVSIWVHVGLDSQMTWTVTGPNGATTESTYIPAGTYSMELGIAEASDVGFWTFEIFAMSGSLVATDVVQFEIVPAKGSLPPAPTTGTLPPSSVTQENATALDALIALKMAEGSLPAESAYDADGDGQVTVEDARQILRWAVQ